jgi:hypothetical protein
MSVNHEVKGNLAKLLATENLVIEHKKVSTASFDVVNRILVLPIWDRATSTVYDLLVGHEVGHALYTPADDWRQCLTQPIPPDYVNVIEDARIEKLMKRKYPGLRKSFYQGYQELNDADFFSIADEDMSKMSLIDRINLHFKVGNFALVPFSDEEQQFVEMTEEAETFADVLLICEQIVTFLKDNYREEHKIESNAEVEIVQGGNGGPSEMQSSGSSFTNEGFDDGADGEQKQSDNSTQGDEQSPTNGKKGGGPSEEEVSKTQRAFDSELESLTDVTAHETDYVELPEIYIDKVIVDHEVLNNYISQKFQEEFLLKQKYWGDVFQDVDSDYRKYKQEAVKEVNYLVKEFECKKSADAYARVSTSRTGVLDTKMLHSYKFNDDVFKKVSVVPDGKNHGLIFILDWSGSMSDYLLDTVKQLLNLVWFCKKVQIPFEVYAFTYEWSDTFIDSEAPYKKQICKRKDRHILLHDRFSLLNFLSSRAKSKDFERDCLNLWRLATRENSRNNASYNIPSGLSLSGTPLNESIIALHSIIPMFKNREHLQKVNVVILTDGEGNGLTYNVDIRRKYGYGSDRLGTNTIYTNNALRDRKTGHVYRNFSDDYNHSLTTILLENLKHNFPYVNLIGFRIMVGSEFSYLYRGINDLQRWGDHPDLTNALKHWRKFYSYEFNAIGYDALYALSSSKLNQEASFEVADNASTAAIGKAFRDMMKTKRTSKKILSSFATLVS